MSRMLAVSRKEDKYIDLHDTTPTHTVLFRPKSGSFRHLVYFIYVCMYVYTDTRTVNHAEPKRELYIYVFNITWTMESTC